MHDPNDFNKMKCIVNHLKTNKVYMIDAPENLTICFNHVNLAAYVQEVTSPVLNDYCILNIFLTILSSELKDKSTLVYRW